VKRHLPLAAISALLLLVALWPGSGEAPALDGCLICGEDGVARGLIRMLLLFPLGLVLGRSPGWRGVVAALTVVVALELLELAVPGGSPTAGEMLFGAAGAGLGNVVVSARGVLFGSGRRAGDAFAVGTAALAGAVMFLTGWALRPVDPEPPFLVEWAPTGRNYAEYGGTVANAGIARLRVRPGPTAEALVAVNLLRAGAPLGAWVVVGPPPHGFAPFIAIFDASGAETAVLGADGSAVAFRARTRASELRLVNPVVRLRGAMDSLAVGDSARIATGRAPSPLQRCFDVATRRVCGVGYTGAAGWALLFDVRDGPPGTESWLDALWLLLLGLPIGLRARPGVAAALFIALAWYGVFRLPYDTIARPVPVIALVGLAAGIGAGMLLARRYRSPAAVPLTPTGPAGVPDHST
jgi:hypothetical protein